MEPFRVLFERFAEHQVGEDTVAQVLATFPSTEPVLQFVRRLLCQSLVHDLGQAPGPAFGQFGGQASEFLEEAARRFSFRLGNEKGSLVLF